MQSTTVMLYYLFTLFIIYCLLVSINKFLTNGTDIFVGFNGQTKKIVNGMNLNFIKAERNRIASMFVQFMLNTCYSLVFDDDNAVRIEATRVMSSLAINRKGFLEPILSNRPANNRNLYASNKVVNKKSSFDSNTIDDEGKAEFDVFKDGILKLVPSSIVDKDLFSRAGVNKDGSAKGDSEGSRFADFYYCVSQNHSKCDKAFTVVESNVREISPSSNEIDEIFRLYEVNHVKESILDTLTAADVVDAMQRAENGQKQGEKVLKALYRWKNSYIIHLANGSILWRRAWTSLQTSSTWGYEPIKDPKIEREMLENAIIPLIKDREVDDDSPINYVEYSDKFIDENILGSKAMLGFCLDPLEGPERMRRKLEQDISGSGKSLLSRDAYMLSPKKKSSISKIDETFVADAERAFSPEPTADHEDMEEFLMKVSKRGIIKRVSISGENAFTDATTGLDDSMYVSSLSGNMLNDNENDHQNEDDDDDTVQNTNEDHDAVPNAEDSFRMDFDDNRGKLLRGFSQQDPVVVLSAKESYGVDEEPLTKNTSFNDNHILKGPEEDTKVEGEVVNSGRSQILEDVIKGIIGISDWNEGKLYNVKR